MKTTVDQLQLTIKGSKNEKAKLELQRIRLQNFVKDFQDNNIEYNKVRQVIKGQVEYVLADRRELLRLAIRFTVELLRLEPQKLLSLHYNRSTIHPENDEDLALVGAEQLYEKMLENFTNKVVTNLSDNVLPVSTFPQKRSCGEQAFHPNFGATENGSNDTANALYDNQRVRILDYKE